MGQPTSSGSRGHGVVIRGDGDVPADGHGLRHRIPVPLPARTDRSANAADPDELGRRLRALRTDRDWTLKDVADRCGLSRAFISQVERGQVSPSVASLSRIAAALGVSLAELFTTRGNGSGLVRAEDRVRISYGENRFWDEIVSPSLSGNLLALISTIQPGADSGSLYSHDADEECIIVLSGQLTAFVEDDVHELRPGDALTFESRRQHGWKNAGAEDVIAVWVITPPVF
jgi:transcriptional regulator with XRE-family HTH domain